MIYILYSADYEIFLGENFLPEAEILIEPTRQLLAVCGSIGIPMTLFADVICAWRYREMGLDEFPDAMEDQMRQTVADGHDVQVHLHPLWLSAKKEGDRWVSTPRHALLGTYHDTEEKNRRLASELLKRGRDYLNRLLTPVDAGYRCVAFRAGHYGIQPMTGGIADALKENGYRIDSSVVPGMMIMNEINKIDFRAVPRRPNFWLSGKSGFSSNPAEVFEIPILAYREGIFDFVCRKSGFSN